MKDRSSVTLVQGASWASSPWTLQPQIRSGPYCAFVTLHWLLFAAPADYLITIEPPRSCGLQTTVMHRFRSSASVFLPPSPWAWIDPGVFALFGAGAFMGGTTRLTIALAVIMMEVWVALLGHALLLVLAHALFKFGACASSSYPGQVLRRTCHCFCSTCAADVERCADAAAGAGCNHGGQVGGRRRYAQPVPRAAACEGVDFSEVHAVGMRSVAQARVSPQA